MTDSSDSAKTAVELDEGAGVSTRRPKKMRVSIEHDRGESSDLRKFNLKVPAFSPDDPEIWFALLEGQFDNFGITEDAIKFNNVITNLDILHAKTVKDIIMNPPSRNRYEKIKCELIRRLTASHEKKVKQLLTHEELGDRKASQFLRHLQDLAGPNVPEEFLKSIWCNRLPQNIQTVLASQPTQPLDQLADLADRIQEITSPFNVASTSAYNAPAQQPSEIAELRKMVEHLALKLDEHTRTSRANERSRQPRRRSLSRQQTRSTSSYRKYPMCWYHSKHGANAKKCIKPCDYGKAGNSKGSR